MTDEKEKHVLMHIWQRWLRDPHTGVQSCAMGANLEVCPAESAVRTGGGRPSESHA